MKAYSKIKEVGTGSYGKCYLCKNSKEQKVVLKAINITNMSNKEKKDAINEVQVLASLRHPYIIQYRESFIDGGYLCIVMDYCETGDLYSLIQKTKASKMNFNEDRILRWFSQLALAIKYMHENHILHRDLKSQNLFLKFPDGRLKIGDFGISKILESTTALTKTTIGSPYYMSPEICRQEPYSWSSDVWAMGCMIYEMCCLRIPFDADDIQELVVKIIRGPVPRIPYYYSEEVRELGMALLDGDDKRRPTANAIVQMPMIQKEIRNMLQDETVRRKSQPTDGLKEGVSTYHSSARNR